MKNIFAVFLVLCSLSFYSQKVERIQLKKFLVATMPEALNETSALNFFGEDLFSLNDSGNSSELFKINRKTGEIIEIIETGLINKDWEALANNGESFFIGDIGNNAGSRKDLMIYEIPYSDGTPKIHDIKTIHYSYDDQIDFTPKLLNNNFDGEAMIYLNGNLHVFSKEWSSKKVSNYKISLSNKGPQRAKNTENFKTGYVVTDAAYFQGRLYTVGYTKKTKVFMTVFEETSPGIFFNGKSKKYKLGSTINVGQIEGIAVNHDGIYISGEAFKIPFKSTPQKLYFVPMDRITL